MRTRIKRGVAWHVTKRVMRRLLVGATIVGGVTAGGPARAIDPEELLDSLHRTAFDYFWNEANPANGLIKDRSTAGSPCSVASTGFGLTAICIGIDHGYVSRAAGRDRILTTLNTFWTKPQSSAASGTIGYQGLFYHFLDMNTGLRTWDSELSTIDTALLFAGIMDARQYFSTNDPLDVQVRTLADAITQRADWEFMRNSTTGLRMGWKPGTGFMGFGLWVGYNEAMLLYILALGSPTHPIPAAMPNTWTTWTSGYDYETRYGFTYVTFPPLFGHQYSHCWIDFRYTWDSYMQARGITYFENSRRATLAQREYCIDNPFERIGYGPNVWGLTASDDPFGYSAHGAPPAQNDNGTITPTAVAGSIPFAPWVAIPALQYMYDTFGAQLWSTYGFKDAFNLTHGWFATDYLGIDQGPIILMIENYRTESVWTRFMTHPDVQLGMQRAGFVAAPVTAIGPQVESPAALFQSVPNPSRGVAWIPYRLGTAGRVSLVLYDVSGRAVRTLVDGERSAGPHRVRLDTTQLPSGVYFYQLESDRMKQVRECIVVK